MIRIRCRHPSGFEILVDVPDLSAVDQAVADLLAKGYRPPGGGDTWARTPEGLPICPRHGAVMGKREKQGDVWHSHRIVDATTGEERFCRGYSHKSDDGFAV